MLDSVKIQWKFPFCLNVDPYGILLSSHSGMDHQMSAAGVPNFDL